MREVEFPRPEVTAHQISAQLVFFSSRRRHTRSKRDWSSDVCSSDLVRDTKLVYDLIAYKQERKAIYQKMTIDILPNDNGFPLNTSTGNMLTKVADFLSN